MKTRKSTSSNFVIIERVRRSAKIGLIAALLLSVTGCTSPGPSSLSPRRDVVRQVGSAEDSVLPNASPSGLERSFAEDAFLLFALLEGWDIKEDREIAGHLTSLFFEPFQATFPEVTQDEWHSLMDQYQDRITHLCRTRAAAVLIQHFSHGELQELIRFYETPVGRAYARVYRQLVTDLVRDPQRDALVHEIATQIRTDRMERLISIGTQ